jgi:putative aldouronate transport system substrate-binding protein
MKDTKLIRIVCVLIVCLLALTACTTTPTTTATTAKPTTGTTGTGTTAQTTFKQVEVEFMMMNTTWNPVVWGSDPVTAQFTQKTGVKFKCSAPSGDADQIANVMLVSGDYPEVMSMGSGATFNKYVAAGALMAIDDLAATYNYPLILNKYVPADSQKVYRSDDGKLYGVPSWFSEDGFGTTGNGLVVRNDIYVDMKEPTFADMDALYNYLITLRDKKLTSNGVNVWALAYPLNLDKSLIGCVANIYGSQIMTYKQYNASTKRVESLLRAPEVVKALTWLNKCYNAGLIDPENFTQDFNTFREAATSGKYATMLGNYWLMWGADAALSAVDSKVYYRTIEIPQGTPGAQKHFASYDTSGNMSFLVTKNCKEPEAVTRFIDYYLSDEGEILNFYGVEGNTMKFVDGKPQFLPGVYEAKLADFDGYGKKTGVRVFDVMNDATWNWERDAESDIRKANRTMVRSYAFNGTLYKALQVDSSTTEGILNAEIEANVIAELTKLIIQPDGSSIEAKVQELLKSYESKGLSKLEDIWTAQYNKLLG